MTATGFISQLLQLAIALCLAPLLLGWVNQCRAWLQNKSAPSLLLPYRTIRKLFHKDAVVAENASPIFRITPYIVLSAMALAAAIVHSLATDLPFAVAWRSSSRTASRAQAMIGWRFSSPHRC